MTETLPLFPLVLDQVPPGLSLALAQEGVPTVARDSVRPTGRFVLFDSRLTDSPVVENGQVPLDIHVIRAACDEDPFEQLVDLSATTKVWRVGNLELREQVARVDRREVRRVVLNELRAMLEQAGGIWLRVSPFPFPHRSAFNFRLDHDDFVAEDFQRLLPLLDASPEAFSHYVCASTHEQHYARLQPLADQHIGSHGYRHHTYRSYPDNRANLLRGIASLRHGGFDPRGFVAPHGRYNSSLAETLDDMHVGHSSEFAAGYDDLPFTPPGRHVLQIPVHPVCLGLFLDAMRREHRTAPAELDEAANQAAEYFHDVAVAQYEAGQPIFLYGHPDSRIGRYPQVLKTIQAAVSARPAIWKTNLAEFADWWRQRAGIGLRVYREGDDYRVAVENPSQRPAAIDLYREQLVARLPLEPCGIRFRPDNLGYERLPSYRIQRPVPMIHRGGWKDLMRDQLDWETVTPVADIQDRTWRGWAKWALRHVRGPSA